MTSDDRIVTCRIGICLLIHFLLVIIAAVSIIDCSPQQSNAARSSSQSSLLSESFEPLKSLASLASLRSPLPSSSSSSPSSSSSATANGYYILNAFFEHTASEQTNKASSWLDNVKMKLDASIVSMEVELEKYIKIRYMPYLKVVAGLIDFDSDEFDSNMSESTKIVLRISTIHAYLMIHQSALTSSAVRLFCLFLKKKRDFLKNDNYIMNDDILKATLTYLNYQIRQYTFEHKFEYLNEFAKLCSENESFINKPILEMEKMIDYMKYKTYIMVNRCDESHEHLMRVESKLSDDIKFSLSFSTNQQQVHKYADEFYAKHGLTGLLSAYLFMSSPRDNKDKAKHRNNNNNNKFNFKTYFDYKSKAAQIVKSRFKVDIQVNDFDPILPLDFARIAKIDTNRKLVKLLYQIADDPLKDRFRDELINKSLALESSELQSFESLVSSLSQLVDDSRLQTTLMMNNNKKKKKKKEEESSRTTTTKAVNTNTVGELLNDMSRVITEHQILKACVLERFILLAKATIVDNSSDNIELLTNNRKFIVPFRNTVFALRCQRLLFYFYPVVMSQASDSVSELSLYNFNLDRKVIESQFQLVGQLSEPIELEFKQQMLQKLDKLYSKLKQFQKRETVISGIRAQLFEQEVANFRKLPDDSQDYYVALNDAALGTILSLYLEQTYEKDYLFMFDFIRMRALRNLSRNQKLTSLSVTYGKTIESNVFLWLKNRNKEPN